MDYEFIHPRLRCRRDAMQPSRMKYTHLEFSNRRKVVHFIDFSPNPKGIPEHWKSILGPKWKIEGTYLSNRPQNKFLDLLLADGRVELAEYFAKMLVGYAQTGWILDKDLVLLRSLDTISEGPEYDLISSYMFCRGVPGVDVEENEAVGLQAAYMHVMHPIYLMAMECMAVHYKNNSTYEDKYYTYRLLSRLLIYSGFVPSVLNVLTRQAFSIFSAEYIPELEISPEYFESKSNYYGYLLVD